MGEKTKAMEEREAFRTHLAGGGNILDAPLPGANPEVPDLGTGMAGVVMAGGGQALPPGIKPRPLTEPKAPGSRNPRRAAEDAQRAWEMKIRGDAEVLELKMARKKNSKGEPQYPAMYEKHKDKVDKPKAPTSE